MNQFLSTGSMDKLAEMYGGITCTHMYVVICIIVTRMCMWSWAVFVLDLQDWRTDDPLCEGQIGKSSVFGACVCLV